MPVPNYETGCSSTSLQRLRIVLRGAVQGVGFRPFVYRLAQGLGLDGWVSNTTLGIVIEVEGVVGKLQEFAARLEREKPPRAIVQSLETSWLDPEGFTGFAIRESVEMGALTALVLPDIATCPACRGEIFDSSDRRYFYPFTNCTNCGPRFTIIRALPYDRQNTSMREFEMCAQCRAEYVDPLNRRFHAQPNACPDCGPRLFLWNREGQTIAQDRDAMQLVAEAICAGRIVAVKGLGGFHLVTAAWNEDAVRELRRLKHREAKPFALMFPSIESVIEVCRVSPAERRLLESPEAPIVLLRRLHDRSDKVAVAVAPGNPNLGAMLPSNPLHLLLLSLVSRAVIATSGNLTDEPICIDEREALQRLGGIASLFLVHNRPILRHVDDSIVRIVMGREMVLRRARGYAPLPIPIDPVRVHPAGRPVLAVGAHLKNTVALATGRQVFLSQHIGDLETAAASDSFRRVIADLSGLYHDTPSRVISDLHPDYLSTQYAREFARTHAVAATMPLASESTATSLLSSVPQQAGQLPMIQVQHHLAHVVACMAENDIAPPVLGVAWDGTGYGSDGTVWGGEFFDLQPGRWERFAHFRCFRLPGGEAAVKEPRRSALGLLWERFGEAAFEMAGPVVSRFSAQELRTLRRMLEGGVNSPLTSSVGRLFDAVASIAGIRQRTWYEGQAAMELEFALETISGRGELPAGAVAGSTPAAQGTQDGTLVSQLPTDPYGFALGTLPGEGSRDLVSVDWTPSLEQILADVDAGVAPGIISVKFHNALAEVIGAVAERAGHRRVVLSGGCFQNVYLLERSVERLRSRGFQVYWHQRVPPNDGGISLGQAVAALGFKV